MVDLTYVCLCITEFNDGTSLVNVLYTGTHAECIKIVKNAVLKSVEGADEKVSNVCLTVCPEDDWEEMKQAAKKATTVH